jgi:20S proteasome subunit alpha 7
LLQGYYGAATGKGRQAAKAELEKLDLQSPDCALTLKDAITEAARIIYVAHEDSKDKDFELEMTWISALDGPTKGRHEQVPEELLEEAEKAAKKSLEGDDDEEEEDAMQE